MSKSISNPDNTELGEIINEKEQARTMQMDTQNSQGEDAKDEIEVHLHKIFEEMLLVSTQYDWVTNDNDMQWLIQEFGVNKAKQAIQALIDTKVNEARIDEIKRYREAMTFAHMTPSIYAAERIPELLSEASIDERLATLKSKENK